MSDATKLRNLRPPGLAAGLAFAAALASAVLGQRVFDGVPHVADGVSCAFQGKIFAAGRPWLDPPPVPEAFASQNVLLNETRWCGIYPPGFPLLLAAGWLLGVPFLVNPVLFGLAVFGVFRLGADLLDETTGLLGALLLAVSPWALLMGASFMSGVAGLSVLTWALVFLARGSRDGGRRPLLLAGFLGSFGVVARPQAAVFFLLPALLVLFVARRREIARVAGLLALGAAVPLALLLAYNAGLSGHPFRMAYNVWDPGMTFAQGGTLRQFFLAHLPWYVHDLGVTVWGFPWGDLFPLLLLLVPAPRRRWDAWLFAGALALVLGLAGYHVYDVNHGGPRFAFEALGALALLVARGLRTGGDLAASLLGRLRVPRVAPAVAAAALVFIGAWPLATLLPRRARALSHAYHAHTKEPLRRLEAAGAGASALVLFSGNTAEWTYGSLLVENGTDPRLSPRVYARDLPGRRDELLAAYPRAEVWLVQATLRPIPQPDAYVDNTWDVADVACRRVR